MDDALRLERTGYRKTGETGRRCRLRRQQRRDVPRKVGGAMVCAINCGTSVDNVPNCANPNGCKARRQRT